MVYYRDRRKQAGFTLLEVLLILGLMMSIISIVAPRWDSAEDYTSRQADFAQRARLEGAVELYKLDTGTLPEGMDDLYSPPPGLKGWRGPYLHENWAGPAGGPGGYELEQRGQVIP